MNIKVITVITTAVVLLGLITATIFNQIDYTTFTTLSTATLSLFYAIYNKWKKDEVIDDNLKLQDKILFSESENDLNKEINNMLTTEIKYLNGKLLESKEPIIINPVITTEDAKEVTKVRKTRSKSKE